MKPADIAVGALVIGFLYLPIAVLTVFAFNDSELMSFPLTGFTWRWFANLAGNDVYWNGIAVSMAIAVPVGIMSMAFGLCAALVATTAPPWLRTALALCLLATFLAPKSVLAIAQAMMLTQFGLPRGPVVLALSQMLTVLPFTTALLVAARLRIDPALGEAARDLGATPRQVFSRITLPLLKGTISACISVGIILSLADVTLASYLSGRTQPLSRIVASEFLRELRPEINAIQVVLLVVTATVVVAGAAVRAVFARRR